MGRHRTLHRALGTVLLVVGLSTPGWAAPPDQARAVPAPPPPRAVLGNAVTDNYKTWDHAASDSRTSMIMDSVTVGTTKYVVNHPGTANGAPTTMAEGIPLKVAGGGGGTTAHLRVSGVSQYRIFDVGVFGPFYVVNKATLPTTPVTFTLTVHRAGDGAVIASTPVEYRHDNSVASLGNGSLEHNGPGGRWYVHDGALLGGMTPLNWPSHLGFSATTVPAGVPAAIVASPLDITGLPVPRFHDWPAAGEGPSQPMPLTLSWNPNTGQPTQTTGDAARRPVPVTLAAGTYQVSATATCEGFCSQDYSHDVLTGSGTVTAQAGAATTATVSAWDKTFPEGSAGAWTPVSVDLHRLGRLGATTTLDVAAIATDDLALPATRVTWAPGETVKEIFGHVYGDTTAEGDETFDVVLTGAGADLVDGTITVTDDDEGAPASHDTDSALRRLPDGPWKGAGVVDRSYTHVGADQTLGFAVARRKSASVSVRITNTGDVTESYWVASQMLGSGAKVSFWAGGDNQTAPVTEGSYGTGGIAPGSSRKVTVTFTVPRRAKVGATRTLYVHAYPAGDAARKDVVRMKVRVK